jgi:hypothetical protein
LQPLTRTQQATGRASHCENAPKPCAGGDAKASPNQTLPADLLPVSGYYGEPENFANFKIVCILQRAAMTPQAMRLPEFPAGCDL